MGRIKEYNPNRNNRRVRRPIIYIVCEGKETEIKYFKRFRKRGCLIDIKPVESQYKDAVQLIGHAKDTIKPGDLYPSDGDELWCVFDRDENTDAQLTRAKEAARKYGYNIAFSNPCFELWFILHYRKQKAHIENADIALKILKGFMPDYEKNSDVYDELLEFQAIACERSEIRMAELSGSNLEIISRSSNPCTSVSMLVRRLSN